MAQQDQSGERIDHNEELKRFQSDDLRVLRPETKDLSNLVTPQYSSHWKAIGTCLRIERGKLDAIEYIHNRDVERCCNEMFILWLDTDHTAAWSKVFDAIESIGEPTTDQDSDQQRAELLSRIVDLELGMIEKQNAISSLSMKFEEQQSQLKEKLSSNNNLVDIFENNLQKSYEVIRSTSEENEWPPNQPKKIVNVVVIHHTSKKGQKEAVAQQFKIGGPVVHQVVSKKKPFNKLSQQKPQKYSKDPSDDTRIITKDISDIFFVDPTAETSIVPRTILIEGAPGIGKTVFAEEIAYKWANGELLDNKKFLLLFYMRDQHVQTVTRLSDLLEVYANEDKEMISRVKEHINRNGGEDVAFLLDGFDECPVKISFIHRLIRGDILPNATVVVTSRPTVSTFSFEKRVEILGFAEEQRNQYIEVSLTKHCSKGKLLEYLDLYPVINSICYIPLCLAIFMYLFKVRSLPKTLTEMNKLFIIHTVCHYMSKKGEESSGGFTDIKDFPEAVYAMIHKLSELAYVGLQQSKFVFTSAEVKKACPHVFSVNTVASNGYGLLQSVKSHPQRGAAGHTTSFNFLHLTIQEYLAAYFVSTLPPERQLIEIKSFWKDDLAFMWMMYVGLSGVHSTTFQQFLHEFASSGTVINRKKGLHLFQCLFEGDKSDVKIPDVISGLFADDQINLQGLTLLPYHVLSLTTFMAKSPSTWKSINLENCHMGDTGMTILRRFLSNKRYKSKTSTIEQIDIFGNDLPSLHDAYRNMIEKGYFQRFKMSKHKLTDKFVAEVASAVSENSTIQALDISSNSFGVDGVEAIASCLKCNKTLESLDISDNSIGRRGTDLIAGAICNNTVLKELKVSRSDLRDGGAAVIAKHLGLTKLKRLDLSWNSISSKGTSEIAYSLGLKKDENTPTEGAAGSHQENESVSQVSANLEVLNLSHNKVGNGGAECLSSMLKVNSSLKVLDISYNGLTDEGVAFICDSLTFNTTLQHLKMSGNYITSANRIAGALELNQYLTTLNIQQYSAKPLSFYSTILNALHRNTVLTWLGLPKCCTEQSQLDEAIAEINISRSHQNIRAITVEYYN